MTDFLYLPDRNYDKKFDSEVSKVKEGDGYIVLEETLFYPEGGGQPADHGVISWDGNETEVTDVQKKHGEAHHFIEGDDFPEEGQEVRGEIDWERRYKHMRMHTAQHVLSLVVLDEYGATTAGNQIHEDYSRIDFKPVEFDEGDIEKIQNAANALIAENLSVEKKMMDREQLEEEMDAGRANMDLIPDHIDPLRAVIIGEDDVCPCGGTHVDNLEEIGEIEITEQTKKGADTERLEFELEG